MPLHMIKLCVGVDTIDDLREWVGERREAARAAKRPFEQIHTTRMFPKRNVDILDGGSLYWVIKGHVQVRQRILDLRPVTDADGIARCQIVLEPEFTATDWAPRRPFQGWRYLEHDDRPADIDGDRLGSGLPPELMRELAGLGLL
ncbi:DUF1489 family protein [Antarcticirhabdus aurantiaca]|uniref:DUF1489 family protein n=1 Tax=Antarcticirhabdus aurantiaca TaxID=2606717 RepID=A0ACD4NVM1_9HYPH|nr:DUF1489 family protein [Antarcticirhabdus aurantiaca]WAJ30857.1 DUF1489 family protein [Jeongeuplla avenae]